MTNESVEKPFFKKMKHGCREDLAIMFPSLFDLSHG